MGVIAKTGLLIFLSGVLPAIATANDENEQLDLYVHQQKIALKVELDRLAIELNLDRKCFDEIQSNVDKALHEGARKLRSHLSLSNKDACEAYGGMLARELADAIHAQAKKHVDAEKYVQYRKDYEKVIAWEDKYAQRYLLVFLDEYFQFNPSQLSELEKRFAAKWNPIWNFKAVTVSFGGYDVCRPVLDAIENDPADQGQFTALLTEKQIPIFKRLNKLALSYSRFTSIKPDADVKIIEAQLPFFMDRAMEELAEFVDLDEKSHARLKVGFKGAWISLAKKRKAANLEYKENTGLWTMSAFMKSSHQQMREEPIWKNAVARLLTKEQMAVHSKQEEERRDARFDVGVAFGIMYLHRRRRLKYKELVELHRLAVEKVKLEQETNLYRSTFILFAQSDEFFKNIFGEETMQAIEPQLSKARSWKRE